MPGYGQTQRAPAQKSDGGAAEHRTAARDHAPAADMLGAALNESPQSRSLMQLRAALDESPRVQALQGLGRTLNRTNAPSMRPIAMARTSHGYSVQRAEARSSVLRDFSDNFRTKHLRDASRFVTEDAMIEAAWPMFHKRIKNKAIPANTMVFMNAYQQELFRTQKHTPLGADFESTTQFPVVDISSDGTMTFYSAAKFAYSATWKAGENRYEVDHLFGVTSGTATRKERPQPEQHIIFSDETESDEGGT